MTQAPPSTTTRVLQRLLDTPHEIATIRRLGGPAFVALVRDVGLEDAGELLALATDEQVLELLDEEVWRSTEAGQDEAFDAARFVVWLEVLQESGDDEVARRLAALPEDLLATAICRQMLVLAPDALGHDLAGASWDEAEAIERVLDECLHLEFAGHTLVARDAMGWDSTVAALVALDRHHHELVSRLLERCHFATIEASADPEGRSLLLSLAEAMESDAFAERDDRRARQGYVSRSSAQAFLAIAAQTPLDGVDTIEQDAISKAYFRELGPMSSGTPTHERPRSWSLESSKTSAVSTEPVEADGVVVRETSVFREAMRQLSLNAPEVHARRLAELGFLANVIVSSRDPHSPSHEGVVEAATVVLDNCERGFSYALERGSGVQGAVEVLARTRADVLFRIGWRLHHDEPG